MRRNLEPMEYKNLDHSALPEGSVFSDQAISRITKYLNRFAYEDATLETKRRIALLAGISLIGIFALIPFSVLAYIQGNHRLAIFDLAAAAVLCVNLIDARRRKKHAFNIHLGTSFVAAFYIYLYLGGGIKNTAFVWYFTFPLIASFLLGSKKGIAATLLMTAPVLLVIFFDLPSPPFADYTIDFEIRFLFSYLVVGAFAYLFENMQEKNRKELWVLNEHLEQKVHERTKELNSSNQQLLFQIEERIETEEALQKREEEYRLLVEEINDVIFRTDQNGKITFVSPVVKSLAGYDPSDLIGQHFAKIIYPEDLELVTNRFKELLSGVIKPSEYRIVNKSGEPVWVRSSSNLIYDGKNIAGVRGVLTNISEEKELATQLQRTQKMKSLGLMAGGIAHDLNNILSGIVSYPELLLMDLPENSRLRKPIETIKESGMRAADVVSDLLTITRGIAIGKEVSNLNTIIREYFGSVEYQVLKNIHPLVTFKTDLGQDLLNIRCSSTHIMKSLVNLIMNASEAIEKRGTVSIITKNRYLDEPLRGYENIRTGEYAVLTVSDNGMGISPANLDRVFEPFYTKKVMGRSGTGLGLAIVWNTLQEHDGYINVKTGQQGTMFELYFPTTRDEMVLAGDAVPLNGYMGDNTRILVVDDEERQREIACGILSKLGYEALAVSSGEEAIDYLKEHPVDLIVLDMIMPKGINGRETYERIIEIHPGQKAIIASGYSETTDVIKAQNLGAGKCLKKPYTMEKIGLAVKEELEK